MKLKLSYLIFLITAIPLAAATEPTPRTQAGGTVPTAETVLPSLVDRIQALESRIASFEARIDELQTQLTQLASKQRLDISDVAIPVTDRLPAQVTQNATSGSTPASERETATIEIFRKGLMLFRTEQYSEAILTLAQLIQKNPDHILAGSAQYYLGECYMNQKEYRLALEEFQQVLASYPLSAHISETLSRLVTAEEALKKTEEAKRYRQILTSTFPQSPAAGKVKIEGEVTRTLKTSREMKAEIREAGTPPTANSPSQEHL